MEGGIASSKLDFDNPNREKMRKVVLIVLKKVVDLSNANLMGSYPISLLIKA